MLSYRHIFHAGNHADVLKHIILQQTLLYFRQKETPFYYIDTHAGGGIYALDSEQAQKSQESKTGVLSLFNNVESVSPVISDYQHLIRTINKDNHQLSLYPGSPYIAELLLREIDRIRLFEMHSTEIKILEKHVQQWENEKRFLSQKRGKRIIAIKKDGFLGLKSLLPPPSRRAVVLIDPSYEMKQDYQNVIITLSDALKRFSTGTYLVWYPILQRLESRRFPGQLKKITNSEWLNITLRIAYPVPDGTGFVASGMFIVNPPWKLAQQMEQTMPILVDLLKKDDGAEFSIDYGTSSKKNKETD